MDTQRIKGFLLAAEYGSLAKAAEAFAYTPSALSHSVDALEKELGLKLLVRTHSGVELTREGQKLKKQLQAVVTAEEQLFKDALELSGVKARELRIDTYTSISIHLLPPLLNSFKEKYPETELSIHVTNQPRDRLETGKTDLLFAEELHGYQWLPLCKDPLVAVVPRGTFEDREEIEEEELYGFPFITTDNLSVARHLQLDRFAEIIQLTSDDDLAAVSMVRLGMGVTILPALVLRDQPKDVKTLRLKSGLCRTLGLCYKKDLPPTDGAVKFIRFVEKKGLFFFAKNGKIEKRAEEK